MNNSWERVPNFKNAFSLMEMMVVLLIVAILAAATAPMVTKKMARNAGSGDSPWVFTGLSNDIAYNMNGGNSTAIIGATQYNKDSGPAHPRLVLANGNDVNQPALVFAGSNGNYLGQIVWTASKVAMSNGTMGDNSVAFGMRQTIGAGNAYVTAIGYNVKASATQATAIGYNVKASATQATAIGSNSTASTQGAVALGTSAYANGQNAISIGLQDQREGDNISGAGSTNSIAIGTNAHTANEGNIAIGWNAKTPSEGGSIAIGANTNASGLGSVVIGNGAETKYAHEIVLGTAADTVYIPGNLVVEHSTLLGVADGSINVHRSHNGYWAYIHGFAESNKAGRGSNQRGADYWIAEGSQIGRYITHWHSIGKNTMNVYSSDRRLKNVGEKYTAGLDELKKLEFFHYTFKKDEAKTPHVGVMAQDLQKVFPNAVTEGEDGYLQIRWEDMFYAVINAVKELDTKICEIVENLTSLSKKVDEQQQLIETQQTLIEELQKQNVDLEKRLMKLEKKKGTDLPK